MDGNAVLHHTRLLVLPPPGTELSLQGFVREGSGVLPKSDRAAAAGRCLVSLIAHCSIVLYYTGLICTALRCSALHCAVLYCTALHCIVLYCTALYCTALHCTVLHCAVLHCTALYCTALRCIVLHCAVLHCTLLVYRRPTVILHSALFDQFR